MKADTPKNTKVTAVVETISADLLTPLAVYLKLAGWKSDSFLLESVEGGTNVARYSFIGVGPQFRVRDVADQTSVSSAASSTTVDMGVLEYLRENLSSLEIDAGDEFLPFAGGAIGYLGFDSIGWFEKSLQKTSSPRSIAEFMIFNSMIAFDHVKQQIKIITLAVAEEGSAVELPSVDEAKATNRSLKQKLMSGEIVLPPESTQTLRSTDTETVSTQADFENAVVAIKGMIAAGECYQVVLSRQLRRPTNASAVSLYRALRSINPSPYMFLLNINGRSIVGASPEMLVRCTGTKLEYRPIAGTRPRGADDAQDIRLAEDMRQDPKEVAEHMMLVDLGRNDLGRVSKFGSVKVDKLMHVEKYSHVQHLVSELSSELAEGKDRFDALGACFPAGTVSGAPKVRAVEIIRELEPVDRGVYAGAVGYFDYAGNMDTCIAIRTIVLEDGVATIQTGAGIVADSVPETEFQETMNKARAMFKAIEIAEANAE